MSEARHYGVVTSSLTAIADALRVDDHIVERLQ